ncbi:MAG: hypothetical protein ACRCX2_07360, partial [Paraclostridium sp.]
FYVGDSSALRRIVAYKKSSPFVGDKPLDSISLCFYGDSTGIKEWNRNSDPMPIKTMNNNGLQVLEEVPGEYKIYIDKDAVFTTVAKYAPGSYQTFMERKADVDNSRSLLKGYKIEWTQQDDSELFIQCNNEAISKIENQPMTLDEPTQPVVLEPKTVPATYECCFRMDKKSGEFYIGEGYERKYVGFNGFSVGGIFGSSGFSVVSDNVDSEGYRTVAIEKTGDTSASRDYFISCGKSTPSNKINHIIVDIELPAGVTIEQTRGSGIDPYTKRADGMYECFTTANSGNNYDRLFSLKKSMSVGEMVAVKYKIYSVYEDLPSPNPKPHINSVMPSGKLDRISNANESTRTFLNKGDGVVTFGNGYFSLKGDRIQQLLVYNALLTEQEKQTELAKDIKLR